MSDSITLNLAAIIGLYIAIREWILMFKNKK